MNLPEPHVGCAEGAGNGTSAELGQGEVVRAAVAVSVGGGRCDIACGRATEQSPGGPQRVIFLTEFGSQAW